MVAVVRPPVGKLFGLRLELVQVTSELVPLGANVVHYLTRVFAHWTFS